MRWLARYPIRRDLVFTARQWALSHGFASDDGKYGGKQNEGNAHTRSHTRPARVILNAAAAHAHEDKVCVALHDECTATSPSMGRPRSMERPTPNALSDMAGRAMTKTSTSMRATSHRQDNENSFRTWLAPGPITARPRQERF